MRRLGLRTLLLCTAFAFVAFSAVAAARVPSSPTKVILDQFTETGSGPDAQGHFVGHLESPKQGCVRDRTVKLFMRDGNDGSITLADTDKTGRHGGWVLDGGLFTIDRAQVRATRKVIGSGDNRRICKAGTFNKFFA
jgi:hypothetical protein